MFSELCDYLIAQGPKIYWGGQGMIRKEMTKELLTKMKKAGCTTISYGVESGSTKVLRLMRKGYDAQLAERVIQDTYHAGIKVIFNIIVGFPGETQDDITATKEFLRHCRKYAQHIEWNTLLLLKGSYLYNNLDEFQISPIDYCSDWQLHWQTNDGLNTYQCRQQRLKEVKSA